MLAISSIVIVIERQQDEIKITPINVYEEGSEYSDLYKVECGDKKFYTSYPDRLKFEEVC